MQVLDLSAQVLVGKKPFRTVAKWENAQALTALPHSSRQSFQLIIRNIVACQLPAEPTVLDAGSIDTKQSANARMIGSVVDVGEAVDAVLSIRNPLIRHAIYDAGGAARRRYFARQEDVERQGIVRLIACPISDGHACGQAQFGGSQPGE